MSKYGSSSKRPDVNEKQYKPKNVSHLSDKSDQLGLQKIDLSKIKLFIPGNNKKKKDNNYNIFEKDYFNDLSKKNRRKPFNKIINHIKKERKLEKKSVNAFLNEHPEFIKILPKEQPLLFEEEYKECQKIIEMVDRNENIKMTDLEKLVKFEREEKDGERGDSVNWGINFLKFRNENMNKMFREKDVENVFKDFEKNIKIRKSNNRYNIYEKNGIGYGHNNYFLKSSDYTQEDDGLFDLKKTKNEWLLKWSIKYIQPHLDIRKLIYNIYMDNIVSEIYLLKKWIEEHWLWMCTQKKREREKLEEKIYQMGFKYNFCLNKFNDLLVRIEKEKMKIENIRQNLISHFIKISVKIKKVVNLKRIPKKIEDVIEGCFEHIYDFLENPILIKKSEERKYKKRKTKTEMMIELNKKEITKWFGYRVNELFCFLWLKKGFDEKYLMYNYDKIRENIYEQKRIFNIVLYLSRKLKTRHILYFVNELSSGSKRKGSEEFERTFKKFIIDDDELWLKSIDYLGSEFKLKGLVRREMNIYFRQRMDKQEQEIIRKK